MLAPMRNDAPDGTPDLPRRKRRHVDVCLGEEVEYAGRTTGLELLDLPYRALPEVDRDAVDLRTRLLGRELAAPLLIGAMTGGSELSGTINRNLAVAAQRLGVGLMLGSQRVMLEHPEERASFEVRPFAPDALVVGNLGVAQLRRGYGAAELVRAVEEVGADAIALHANPLQEAMQEGGDTDFAGLVGRLAEVVPRVPYPVLLKEVGHGLSGAVARAVAGVPFAALDVAGAGGTSWARVEQLVRYGRLVRPDLAEWGLPTAEALRQVRAARPDATVIASGGIRTGLDVAKALALGAGACALALPLLRPATESPEAVVAVLERVIEELRTALFVAGAADLAALARLEPIARP